MLGEIVTRAGGAGVIVRAVVPTLPSLTALMDTDPAAIPVTSPDEFTVASAGLELCHATTRPVST